MAAIKEMENIIEQNEFFAQNASVDEAATLLDKARNILKKRLSFFVFQGFFEPLMALSLKDGCFIIEAPTAFHRNWVVDHYMPELILAVKEASNENLKVQIVDSTDNKKRDLPLKKKVEIKKTLPKIETKTENEESLQEKINTIPSNLNPKYTFDSFVEGPSNQMCFKAALEVAKKPGQEFSPLFIFGAVGVGKTHLLHAIGLMAKQKNPSLRVLYVSTEQWVNSYIYAVREKQFDSFRAKYRNDCDILLIDDIQFLAGKDASQDEFFHTFNALHEAKKQIVVTSDKYPHEIQGLEERLQTRLSWGLVADMRPPDMETRLLILQQKAKGLSTNLSPDILSLLAASVTSSVRELEGALLRLSAFSSLTNTPLSLGKAKEFLTPMLKRKATILSWQKICEQVAQGYGLRTSDLIGKSRQKQVSFARSVAMMHCRSLLSMSLPEIGKAFGGRDHSTVISALKKMEGLKQKDISLATNFSKMEERLLALSKN